MKSKVLFAVLILCTAVSAFSQEEVLPVVRNTTLSTGVFFQAWSIEKSVSPITQVSFPVHIVMPLKPDMHLSVTHTPSLSWWYDDTRLSGLSDTWVQAAYVFFNDKVMADVGIGIPTGKTRMTNTEYELSRVLSKRVYQFKTPVTGQGFCAKAGLAGAYDITEWMVLGLGASYIKKTAYHPVTYEYTYQYSQDSTVTTQWEGKYRPGDELTFNVGCDFSVSESVKIMFDVLYTRYGKDERDGSQVFSAGDRFDVNLGLFWRMSDSRFMWAHAVLRQSGKNELMQGLYFKQETENTNGPQADLDINYKAIPFKDGGLFLLAEGRFYGRNEEGWGGAQVIGGGLRMSYNFSQSSSFFAQIKYFGGALKGFLTDTGIDDSVSLEGFELGGGFTFTF